MTVDMESPFPFRPSQYHSGYHSHVRPQPPPLQMPIFTPSIQISSRPPTPPPRTVPSGNLINSGSEGVIVLSGASAGITTTRKRPKYTRSKTGCMTCRVKKIKCDEAKPICSKCSHGQRECTWPPEPQPSSSSATSPSKRKSQRATHSLSVDWPNGSKISPISPTAPESSLHLRAFKPSHHRSLSSGSESTHTSISAESRPVSYAEDDEGNFTAFDIPVGSIDINDLGWDEPSVPGLDSLNPSFASFLPLSTQGVAGAFGTHQGDPSPPYDLNIPYDDSNLGFDLNVMPSMGPFQFPDLSSTPGLIYPASPSATHSTSSSNSKPNTPNPGWPPVRPQYSASQPHFYSEPDPISPYFHSLTERKLVGSPTAPVHLYASFT